MPSEPPSYFYMTRSKSFSFIIDACLSCRKSVQCGQEVFDAAPSDGLIFPLKPRRDVYCVDRKLNNSPNDPVHFSPCGLMMESSPATFGASQ